MLVELPLPIEPELEPVLGVVVLGDVVLEPVEPLEEPLPMLPVDEPDEPVEPLVPPELELEPDLLKCASHSEREIWPSLLVSTDEKLGVALLPELELGELVLDELPPAAPVDDLSLDVLESAAAAASERAKSAAAVVTVTVLIMEWSFGLGKPPSTRKLRAVSGKLLA